MASNSCPVRRQPNRQKHIHNWHHQAAKVAAKSAFVPLKFQLCEAFQFDWSEENLTTGDIPRKFQVPHTKLCARHAFWLVATRPKRTSID